MKQHAIIILFLAGQIHAEQWVKVRALAIGNSLCYSMKSSGALKMYKDWNTLIEQSTVHAAQTS